MLSKPLLRNADGDRLCSGRLEVLFADESSYRCTECDWSGWPRQDVERHTGRILRQYPHPYEWYAHLHRND